jgi:hypothetical protein
MLNTGFTLRVDVHDNNTGQEVSATKHVEYEDPLRRIEKEDLL